MFIYFTSYQLHILLSGEVWPRGSGSTQTNCYDWRVGLSVVSLSSYCRALVSVQKYTCSL